MHAIAQRPVFDQQRRAGLGAEAAVVVGEVEDFRVEEGAPLGVVRGAQEELFERLKAPASLLGPGSSDEDLA